MDDYKHVPSYIDLGEGVTIDENRWPLLLDAVVHGWTEANPDVELRPGLEVKRGDEHQVLVFATDVTGVVHQLGWFDARWLEASVPMPETRGVRRRRDSLQ